MPYASKEKQRAASQAFYLRHKERLIAESAARQKLSGNGAIYARAYRKRHAVIVRERERNRRGSWDAKTRAAKHWAIVLRRHGVSPSWFAAQNERQAGACALCGAEPRKLRVDRDPCTRALRGLLCASCRARLHRQIRSGWLERLLRYLVEYGRAAKAAAPANR